MPADIDCPRLHDWLELNVPELGAVVDIAKFAGGQSNPTYRLVGRNSRYVLRRKPFGTLLPSAHAIEREYRLLSALYPTGYPVPRPLAICKDSEVIGANFYVMALIQGRNFAYGSLPEIEAVERGQLYHSMIENLAKLHSIDVERAGLGDFGKSGNYFARQVTRWTAQYRSSQTDDIPEVDRLIEWLPQTVPVQTRSSIIHGDYRVDNLIFDHASPTVSAVLDWELATIGDPLADFAYLLMNWIMPPMGSFGIVTDALASSGIPSMEEAIAIYCATGGSEDLTNLHWYFAYNLFRLTGIAQGVKSRMLEGNASSAKASEAAELVPAFARLAWEQAKLACA